MEIIATSEETAGLYRAFADSFRANNEEAVRRIYRQLLEAGRPRAEIIDEAMRLATTSHGTLGTVFLGKDYGAAPTTKKDDGEADKIFCQIDQSEAIINAHPDTPGQTSRPEAVASPTSHPWSVTNPREVVPCSAELSNGDQKHLAAPRGSDNIYYKRAVPRATRHLFSLVPQSPLTRLSLTAAIVAVAAGSVSVGVLRVGSTPEKSITISASIDSAGTAPKSVSLSVPNPSMSALVIANNQTAHGGDSAGQPDLNGRNSPTLSRAASQNPPELSAANPTGSSPISPQAANSNDSASLSLAVGRGIAEVQPDMTVARLQEPSAPARLGDLPPAVGRAVVPAAPVLPLRELPLSTAEISVLLMRGDSLFGAGDIVSARLFYERAADAGNGQAALRLGESYDPRFLEQAHLRGVRGDLSAAIFWYQRARDLGMGGAEILLGSLQSK